MRAETRPHEAGFGSNRVSEERGEYVPAPCTHRPSKHPSEVRMRPCHQGRIWASQGGLSRNKVAVGESAAGSPPNDRDLALTTRARLTFHTHCVHRTPPKIPRTPFGPPVRSGTFELPRLTLHTPHLDPTGRSHKIVQGSSGLIAQRQSASFARRMPWVRIPLSPSPRRPPQRETVPLSGRHRSGVLRSHNQCTIPCERVGKDRAHRTYHPGAS